MPAPHRPNTVKATKARERIGDTAAANRLTAAGWAVIPPRYAELVRAAIDDPEVTLWHIDLQGHKQTHLWITEEGP